MSGVGEAILLLLEVEAVLLSYCWRLAYDDVEVVYKRVKNYHLRNQLPP